MVNCWRVTSPSRPHARAYPLEAASWRLGMLPVMLGAGELQLARGETLEDTARALSSYAAAIAVRTFAQADVDALARAASVPVINALTDDHDPCQALADMLTLRDRFGPLDGLRIAYVGDGNNVAHSLIEAASLLGMESPSRLHSPMNPTPRSCTPQRSQGENAPGGSRSTTIRVSPFRARMPCIPTPGFRRVGKMSRQSASRRSSATESTSGSWVSQSRRRLPSLPACASR